MAFSMFSAQTSPIAIDFGTSAVKLLQISGDGKAQLIAATEIRVPDSARASSQSLFDFYGSEIPKALSDGKFRGKRVVTAVPSGKTFIGHMQIHPTDGMKNEDLIKAKLQMELGCSPDSVVVRSVEVGPTDRDGKPGTEMICFAIARDTVMRYVGMLKRCKLDVVGVHTEMMAAVRAFEHLHRRREDHVTVSLYVDLGWGGTRIGITHGKDLKFARFVQFGGRHFDQLIAQTLNCDLATAREHRLAVLGKDQPQPARRAQARTAANAVLQTAMVAAAADSTAAGGSGTSVADDRRDTQPPPEIGQTIAPVSIETTHGKLDLSELLETMSDEIAMCLRYHHRAHPTTPVDRVIFVGGEARQLWLCQHLVKNLQLPAQLGDPLARVKIPDDSVCTGFDIHAAQPGWTVPYGLCTGPTDL